MTRTATVPPTTHATAPGGAKIAGNRGSSHGGPGPQVMSASTLEGNNVFNRADEELGEVKEIMLDVPSGRIAYAVMSAGGFLGIGDKLFALPWNALALDPENHRFVMDASKARFENAPGFDKDHWPSTAEFDGLSDTIHSYWGTPAYWE